MTYLAVYECTGGIQVDFVLVVESAFGREHCLLGRRNCLDRSCFVAASSCGESNLSNSIINTI